MFFRAEATSEGFSSARGDLPLCVGASQHLSFPGMTRLVEFPWSLEGAAVGAESMVAGWGECLQLQSWSTVASWVRGQQTVLVAHDTHFCTPRARDGWPGRGVAEPKILGLGQCGITSEWMGKLG